MAELRGWMITVASYLAHECIAPAAAVFISCSSMKPDCAAAPVG
jgi:hypothetical protein